MSSHFTPDGEWPSNLSVIIDLEIAAKQSKWRLEFLWQLLFLEQTNETRGQCGSLFQVCDEVSTTWFYCFFILQKLPVTCQNVNILISGNARWSFKPDKILFALAKIVTSETANSLGKYSAHFVRIHRPNKTLPETQWRFAALRGITLSLQDRGFIKQNVLWTS